MTEFKDGGAISEDEIRKLISSIREQAKDMRMLARSQAETLVGVADALATDWEEWAQNLEDRFSRHGIRS